MTPGTQAVALFFLGIVLARLAVTDVYLRYVNDWMRWPVLMSGLILVGLALMTFWTQHPPVEEREDHDPGHVHGHVPWATWLLILPALVAFVINPSSLGAYVAERSSNEQPPPARTESIYSPLPEDEVVAIKVSNFVWRAQIDQGQTLLDRDVVMTGFVSRGSGDAWYLTRLAINCCAADASAFRIRVEGAEAPPRNSWVRVTGTWVENTGTSFKQTPALAVSALEPVAEPRRPYE